MDDNRILVVDDEESVQYVLDRFLTKKGCEVVTTATAEQAIAMLEENPPAVALLDIVLPGMNGIELLAEVKARCDDTEVVMITSHGSVDTAVGAIRRGAYDYLQKPFDNLEEVWVTVQRALQKRSLETRNRFLIAERTHRTREISKTVDQLKSLVEEGGGVSGEALVSSATRETDS